MAKWIKVSDKLYEYLVSVRKRKLNPKWEMPRALYEMARITDGKGISKFDKLRLRGF